MNSYMSPIGFFIVLLIFFCHGEQICEASEEERVIGIEGKVLSIEKKSEERSNNKQKYVIVIFNIELSAGDKLTVYEDSSKRIAKVDDLQKIYKEHKMKSLLFTAEFLEGDEDISLYEVVTQGDTVIIRTPYAFFSAYLYQQTEVTKMYVIEKVEKSVDK